MKATQEELDRLRDEKGAAGERRRSSASITRYETFQFSRGHFFCFKGNRNDVIVVFCLITIRLCKEKATCKIRIDPKDFKKLLN